jgi:ubiquitin thioesterase protein OTUB1
MENKKENDENNNKNKNSEYYDENGRPRYEEIIKYENEIRKEIEETTPLVSELKPTTELLQEFEYSEYSESIKTIVNKYENIRLIRRDGNCFYRAFLYRLFEEISISKNEKLYNNIKKIIEGTKDLTGRNGYDWIVIEDFYNVFINELNSAYQIDFDNSIQFIDKLFSDKEKGNYLIVFVRLYIAAYLKENRILYESFIFDEAFDNWIQREVEAIDNECDQIQIMAIVNAFDVCVIIETLTPKSVDTMRFPEDSNKDILFNVLFRPGHYDILYSK